MSIHLKLPSRLLRLLHLKKLLLSLIHILLDLVDQVLIMTVNPGFGGQAFIPEMMSKVERVVELREKGGYSFDIEVDGGVDNNTCLLYTSFLFL